LTIKGESLLRKNEKKRRKCVEDGDFRRCMNFDRSVEVIAGGKLEATGKIHKFTENSIVVDGEYYFRTSCTFFRV
jgi:hypothetical protein